MAQLAIQMLLELSFHKKYQISYWEQARVIKNWVAIHLADNSCVFMYLSFYISRFVRDQSH